MMDSMQPAQRVIPIASEVAIPVATAGCGDCLHDELRGPVCRSQLGQACAAPQFSGPADELRRLMLALAPLLHLDAATDTADQHAPPLYGGGGLLRALHVHLGEVELQLNVSRHCGGALLADSAFQTLRSLLPDTDIYVDLAG